MPARLKFLVLLGTMFAGTHRQYFGRMCGLEGYLQARQYRHKT